MIFVHYTIVSMGSVYMVFKFPLNNKNLTIIAAHLCTEGYYKILFRIKSKQPSNIYCSIVCVLLFTVCMS